jgi:hypothetical protein
MVHPSTHVRMQSDRNWPSRQTHFLGGHDNRKVQNTFLHSDWRWCVILALDDLCREVSGHISTQMLASRNTHPGLANNRITVKCKQGFRLQ